MMTPEDVRQNWYFTFGCGQPNAGKFHVIHGTHEGARLEMMYRFGKVWAMQYSEEEFKGQAEEYNLTELK